MPRAIKTADEQDAYTSWRKFMTRFDRAGVAKRIKTNTHRRERREAKEEIRSWK